MTVIGITGGTGSGKTTALHALKKMGALVIDCDEVYHRLLEESGAMKAEIAGRFPGVVRADRVDRKALGAVAFSDKEALNDLNTITHRYVEAKVDDLLKDWRENGGEIAAVDAIALVESGLAEKCDVVVGVTAPADARAGRIVAREGISLDYARLRIGAQKTDEFFSANCKFILVNDCGTAGEFENKCREFFAEILGGITND